MVWFLRERKGKTNLDWIELNFQTRFLYKSDSNSDSNSERAKQIWHFQDLDSDMVAVGSDSDYHKFDWINLQI